MTDPLDDLNAALRAATPRPGAARRAQNLARAQEIFERAQGTADAARPIVGRPSRRAAFTTGARQMFITLTRPAALAATTALVAGVIFVSLPDTRALLAPDPLTRAAAPAEIGETVAADREQAPRPAPVPAAPAFAAPSVATLSAPAPTVSDGVAAQGRVVKAAPPDPLFLAPEDDTETFANENPNPVRVTADTPVSTFSVDVDTASYAIIRQSIMAGFLPPPEAVRVEEMINYFPYAYPAPDAGAAFRPTIALMQTPWNPGTRLLRIGLQGALPALADRPPLNLVFLIDTSGSMSDANKLPLLIQSFRLMLGQLRPTDEVAIVTYAGSAGLALPPTPAGERSTILAALENLSAGGSTAGEAGLQQAYATAAQMAATGEVSRVILATDGDFNIGLSDPEALKTYIRGQRDSGTYLSVLGFGRGNLDDATMQALAQTGNGTAAYIDTLSEAQKVLVDQLTGALFPIANDVKVQVEFNPATVAEYRLIGYETRALRREDFNNDAVDAGEIGAGHQVTALYEVTPVGSPATLNDPLRYGTAAPGAPGEELAFLRLRAKAPGAEISDLTELAIANTITAPDADTQFAAAIAGFGQVLRGSDYLGGWALDNAIALANGAIGDDPFGYRREAVSLMRLARSLKN